MKMWRRIVSRFVRVAAAPETVFFVERDGDLVADESIGCHAVHMYGGQHAKVYEYRLVRSGVMWLNGDVKWKDASK